MASEMASEMTRDCSRCQGGLTQPSLNLAHVRRMNSTTVNARRRCTRPSSSGSPPRWHPSAQRRSSSPTFDTRSSSVLPRLQRAPPRRHCHGGALILAVCVTHQAATLATRGSPAQPSTARSSTLRASRARGFRRARWRGRSCRTPRQRGGGYELLIDISELYCAAFIDGRWTAGRGVRRRQPQRGGFARVGLHARLDATRVCTLARVTEEASVRHSSVVSRRERVVADLWRGSKTRSSALDSPRDPPRLTRDRHARLVCPRNLQPRQPRRSKLRKGGADTLLIEP